MRERQLRNWSKATGVETALRVSESCHENRELECNNAEIETLGIKESNAQIEVQKGEVEQSPDHQVNNPEKSMTIFQCLQSS